MSTYASQTQFSEFVIQRRYVCPVSPSEDLSLSQSHYKPKLPSLCACPFSAGIIFFKTQGRHSLGWAACQAAVLWREGLPLINSMKPLLYPCRCLCAGRKSFLIFNVCNNKLPINPVQHRKVSHVDHKRKELCLHNSICFAFLPLLMTFIIYSLFWNCFQAPSFLES